VLKIHSTDEWFGNVFFSGRVRQQIYANFHIIFGFEDLSELLRELWFDLF